MSSPSSLLQRVAASRTDFGGEEEEDCGFKFRRVSRPGSGEERAEERGTAQATQSAQSAHSMAPASGHCDVEVPLTGEPAGRADPSGAGRDRRRRRSSFASIASKAGPRSSAISASISQSASACRRVTVVELPPSSVPAADYHKHLMPDLPGPIKMRQLLVWAVKHTASRSRSAHLQQLVERTAQALAAGEISSSWYQRPTCDPRGDAVGARSGPKNTELLDCIQLYQRYSAKFAPLPVPHLTRRLRRELEEWQAIELQRREQGEPPLQPVSPPSAALPPAADANEQLKEQLFELSVWVRQVPALVSAPRRPFVTAAGRPAALDAVRVGEL